MEGKLTGFLEDKIQKTHNLAENSLLFENLNYDEPDMEIQKKNTQELEAEEEKLKLHLSELKKENFMLQTTISAWQKTLKNKLDECKEAGLKLDEIYNKIWLERETFCLEVDKFNDEYGILSSWWSTQMNFISDFDNLEKKMSDDQKCKQDIEKLEKEIEEIKKEIEILQREKVETAEVKVHSTEDGNFPVVRDKNMMRDIPPQILKDIKKTQETSIQIKNCEKAEIVRNDLYSMVDVEMVRTANRNRNRRKAFLGKANTFLTY